MYAAGYVVTTLADNTTDDTDCTLREAILAANNTPANANCGPGSSGDDTITFSVSGAIHLSATLPNIVGESSAGKLTIDGGGNITISGDTDDNGAGDVRVMIVDAGANLTLQYLAVTRGYVLDGAGGGVYNNGVLTITNSAFSGNSTNARGGGIYINNGTVTITNSVSSGNSTDDGGGIYIRNGTVTITNSTFSGNSTSYGDGGGISNFASTVTLKNTIVANSASGGNCGGAITDGGNNLDSANDCGFTINALTNTDPLLGALTGSPAYFPLNTGSPAIDAGTNTGCPANAQNGLARPQDGDGDGTATCDIGSYEAAYAAEMAVTGSGLTIADGDTTPALADHTDFGSVSLGGAITRTFTISNSGVAGLALTGPAAGDFSVVSPPTTPIAPGNTTTFQVRFSPSVVGTRVATMTVANNDSDETPYDFAIQGTGMAGPAQPIYLPLVFKDFSAGPDLVVESLNAGSGGVTVVIKNIGSAPVVDAFWVDVYLNPTTPPIQVNQPWQDMGSQGLVWGIQGAALPLAPGASLTLTIGDAYYFATLSHFTQPLAVGSPVYAQVDSVNQLTTYGGVLESHESSGGPYNNIRQALSTAGVNPATGGGAVSPSGVAGLPPR